MIDQLRYTVRLLRWAPIGVVLLAALALGTALRLGNVDLPAPLLVAVIGAIAASVVSSLHDPAWELLGPVPISLRARLALRVAVACPVALGSWMVLDGLGHWTFGAALGTIGTSGLVALIAAGSATAIAAQRRRPDEAAAIGASVALGWALCSTLGSSGPLIDLSDAWIRRPWPVTAIASIVAVLATRPPSGSRAHLRRIRSAGDGRSTAGMRP